MFDNSKRKYLLLGFWLLLFICLWSIFQITFPHKIMKSQLYKIERSIENNDWEKANEYTTEFNNIYKKKRYLIHMNNSTEVLTTFEHTIGQLTISVKHHSESSLEYIGALIEILNFVVNPFAGP